MTYTANRFHDISVGHRVVGHEHKCRFLHGHNYRIHFYCAEMNNHLDNIGRVIDFGLIKSLLCMWLEENWDHRTLIWQKDEMLPNLRKIDNSVVEVPFNPTAENIAEHLVNVIGPKQLKGTNIRLVQVDVEETRKCSASYTLNDAK